MAILLLFYAPIGSIAAAQVPDFGMRFEFGPCAPRVTERLDTFNGEFTAHGGVPARTVTTPMSLTGAQMKAIYRTVENIRFFDYPPVFHGVPAGVQEVITTTPAAMYRLEIRNGGVVHTVSWTDANTPSSAEADRLRALLSTIRGFIHEHPAFKRLPNLSVGCE